jgi:anaerobic dimethyl sulfoxide reductase subunit A
MLIWASQITDPLYEARDDVWMQAEIGKRLGIDAKIVNPIPLKQMVFNQMAGAKVIAEDGAHYDSLVSITAEDLSTLGVVGKVQSGRIPIQELREKGIYQVKRSHGDNFGCIAYKDFRDDPVANPVKTPSGKLHIFSQDLADEIKLYGWTEVAPIAKYLPAREGYEDTFKNLKRREKGDYPLQLFTPHYLRRSHSVFDNVGWLRRAWPQELMMNTIDALARGLKTGDTVKVTSRHGVVIRPVLITPHIIPGVVALGEGAWADRDDKSGIDRAGATNSLAGNLPCGQGVQAWNTNSVQVEKYFTPLPADYTWASRIVLKKG